MSNGEPVDGSVYYYAPNKGAPVFFAVGFAISGSLHLWQCIRYKCFKLTALHPFSCLLFAVGFAVREYGTFDFGNLNVYIASTILIYLSPPILELANYHILGRILYYVPYQSPLHPGRVLTTFGTLSCLVEVLNAIGVSYIANTALPQNLIDLGHILMKISLVLQLVVIALFFLLAGIFHHRCARGGLARNRRLMAPLLTMYASTVLILVRTIYRVVEHFGVSAVQAGTDAADTSPVVRYEWFFYVFEASLMLVNEALWNVCHPRRYLPEKYQVYLARDGRTEVEGPGWKDERPFVATLVDPFGLCAGERGGGQKKPFWETDGFGSDSALRHPAQGAYAV